MRWNQDPTVWVLVLFYTGCLVYFKPWTLDFPLNDDWAYTLGVDHLFREGRLRLCDWGSPTLVLQLAWGALWRGIFGSNLSVLKLATLTAAAGGVFCFNSILKTLDVPANVRLVAGLLLAANPLYLLLSVSFMTDVPYLCLMMAAFLLYLRAEKADSHRSLLAGSVVAGAAFLVRQLGLLIPLGYTTHLILQKKLTVRKTLLLWGVPGLAWVGYSIWLTFLNRTFGSHRQFITVWLFAYLLGFLFLLLLLVCWAIINSFCVKKQQFF